MSSNSISERHFATLWDHFMDHSASQAWLLTHAPLVASDVFVDSSRAPERLVGRNGLPAGTLCCLTEDSIVSLAALVNEQDLTEQPQRTAVTPPNAYGDRVITAFARSSLSKVFVRFGILQDLGSNKPLTLTWNFARNITVAPDLLLSRLSSLDSSKANETFLPYSAEHVRLPFESPLSPRSLATEAPSLLLKPAANPTFPAHQPGVDIFHAPTESEISIVSEIDAALDLPPEALLPKPPAPANLQGGIPPPTAAEKPAPAAPHGRDVLRGVVRKNRAAGVLLLECGDCGIMIRGKRGNLARHVAARHAGSRAFACAMPQCGRRFQSKLNLSRHMTGVHEARGFRCDLCPRAFPDAARLARHAAAAHAAGTAAFTGSANADGFSCGVCARAFARRSVLKNHVARVHAGAGAAVPAAPPRFDCPVPECAARFADWAAARTHEQEAHAGRVHCCPACDCVFGEEAALSRHIRTEHAATDSSCACPACGSVYSDRANLRRHISLAHKGLRPRGAGEVAAEKQARLAGSVLAEQSALPSSVLCG